MRIAVTSTGPSLEALLDPRFGRCATFVIVETEDERLEFEANDGASLGGGAGIQSARRMAERGVAVVLTGDCGPNAHETLTAAGIDVVLGCEGTVAAVVARFRSGGYAVAGAPNVAPHSGMGGIAS